VSGRRDRWRIHERVLAAILDHAAADAPLECCGLLAAAGDAIVAAYPARNALASETRYLIDPADHFRALRAARTGRRHIVGAYHSHPYGPQFPSARDIAESPGDDWLHAIASRGGPGDRFTVSLFYVARGNFFPVGLVTMR
jgi:proteasome lid subunit RPN8/RPN11